MLLDKIKTSDYKTYMILWVYLEEFAGGVTGVKILPWLWILLIFAWIVFWIVVEMVGERRIVLYNVFYKFPFEIFWMILSCFHFFLHRSFKVFWFFNVCGALSGGSLLSNTDRPKLSWTGRFRKPVSKHSSI